ncbi:MSMEG_0567/Sll0786 family nitrogen starvation N-acetyltransferase [Acidisoma cladoniae]|jgi:putative N-acetyltransferase (TIGR04045 family)|uniref:MSMEG_0567/Sll0786 family nitrogen starvation N-acetyltransferase n=1 Tax=Acidisoma cladoniae TaxID=3040935 RepID=UPI00254CC2BB|nr:MSMEG_0567/Sll0786 family nitrogen starvation N-acetyltransferase [Acidisoma sp. PAMC 29798]
MLLYDAPIRTFIPGEYRIRLASEAWERAGHHRLRRQIFCAEQGIFADDDADAIDEVATTIVAVTCIAAAPQEVVGVVRIHEAEPGLWWGSRLGVDEAHRRVGRLGAELIRMAVCTANERGCRTFLAHVQVQNLSLFRRLHWESLREVDLHGRAHHVMRVDLAHYLPHGRDTTSLIGRQAVARPMIERAA